MTVRPYLILLITKSPTSKRHRNGGAFLFYGHLLLVKNILMEQRNELLKLGAKVKDARESLGLSQAMFAQKCGLSKTYVGMLERGERNPSYLTLSQIAHKINISIKDLI